MSKQDTGAAVVVDKFDAENWKSHVGVQQVPIPQPGDGQALVHMFLRPIHPADSLAIRGWYPVFSSPPGTPGLEGVARVVKSSGKFKEGQRVVGAPWPLGEGPGSGSFQEYLIANEGEMEAVPEEITDEQAAAFWTMPITTVCLLRAVDIPAGEWLIQTAAGSGIGRQIIQVAKSRGIKTINLVRRADQKEDLLSIGADVVISTDETEDYVGKIKEVVGEKGAWAAFDAIAGDVPGKLVSVVRLDGTILVYGVLSGLMFEANALELLFKNISIKGFGTTPWYQRQEPAIQKKVVQEIFDLLKRNVITEYKGETFALKDVVQAFELSEKPGRGPKVYLKN